MFGKGQLFGPRELLIGVGHRIAMLVQSNPSVTRASREDPPSNGSSRPVSPILQKALTFSTEAGTPLLATGTGSAARGRSR
jgi:hypothetical protein